MKSLPSALSAELALDAHAGIIPLVNVALATPILRAAWNVDVSFGGSTYYADNIEFGEISGGLRGSPSVGIRFQNLVSPEDATTYPWSTVLASNVAGTLVTVRFVMASQLADTTATVSEQNWSLNNPRLEGNFFMADLTPPQDLQQLETPQPVLRATRCRDEFKDTFCKSLSSFTTCPGKRLQECLARHDQSALRFSQWPYVDAPLRRTG